MNLSRVLLFDTVSVVNQMDYQNLPLPYKRGRLKEEGGVYVANTRAVRGFFDFSLIFRLISSGSDNRT